MADDGRDLLEGDGRARVVGGSSGSEMVGIGVSEIEMDGIEGGLQGAASSTWIEGRSGTLIVGTMGAEAVDAGM